ncbi:hypothetical protein BD413DRAFT_493603 [Trametes elegans]|nr:hypothetical protein BD413DRAFT_493603 [Trametes elegans]
MAPISILASNLGTVCVESALWGVFFVLSITSLVLLVRRHQENSAPGCVSKTFLKSPLFIASVVLLCTVTAHWIIVVQRLFDAFVHHKDGTAPVEYFTRLSEPTEVALTALNVVSVVICDSMMIARIWIIWGRSVHVIVFPVITTIGLTVCSVEITYQYSRYHSEDLYQSTLGHWITAGYVLTLSTNFYGTGIIAYRIISTSKALKHGMQAMGGRSIMEALTIFVESAALYAAWVMFFFVAYQAQWSINVLANDCLPAISGISLMLITLRISLGWARGPGPSTPPSGSVFADAEGVRWRGPVFAHSAVTGMRSQDRDVYPLHAIALNVSKTVEQETDYALSQRDVTDSKANSDLADN